MHDPRSIVPTGIQSTGATIELILRRVKDIPSLPDVVTRIVDALGNSEIPAAEIARLISYDPGLTSKFLRIVNSSAYGFQRQISSVQHAIMILGFNQVRGVVLSTSIVKLLGQKGNQGLDTQAFWRHSVQAAIAARMIASERRIPFAEDAFSAGILHDIGKIILDAYVHQNYVNVLEAAKRQRQITHGAGFLMLEREILNVDHAELGYQLAERWKLPPTYKDVIRYHHTPEQAQNAPELVWCIALANSFSVLLDHNAGVFAAEWIPESVREYFMGDLETVAPLHDWFERIKESMTDVDDFMQTIQS